MLKICFLDESQSSLWTSALGGFTPLDDIYFSYKYHHASSAMGYGSPHCAIVREGANVLYLPYLCCPIKGASGFWDIQSAYGYGGPLVTESNPDFLRRAWAALATEWENMGAVAAFLRFHPLIGNEKWVPDFWRISFDRPMVAVDLQNGLDSFAGHSASKHRRSISQANRQGFICEERADLVAGLDHFISIYQGAMHRCKAADFYFFPKDYYQSLIEFLGTSISLFEVKKAETQEVFAVSLVLWGPCWAHYHLGASRIEDVNVNLTHLLLQGVAESAVARGLRILHLGGGRGTQADDQLLKFKRRVGNREVAYHTGGKIINQKVYAQLIEQWKLQAQGKSPKWFLGYRQPT